MSALGYNAPNTLQDWKTLKNHISRELKDVFKEEDRTKKTTKGAPSRTDRQEQPRWQRISSNPKADREGRKAQRCLSKVRQATGKTHPWRPLSSSSYSDHLRNRPKRMRKLEGDSLCPEEIEILLQERNRIHLGQSRDFNLTLDLPPFRLHCQIKNGNNERW